MPICAGDRLGPYEILAPIGKGGMGEVWRARDTRLGRDVAIKISAEQFSERFEREARAIAALNHPNICTLHDVGPNYLVMEYIEGATLAERIKEGPIPLEEALGIADHVADALDAAHEKNIIHRDLKPGNIKIKPDGTVKVLDFGLAKMGGTPAAAKAEDSPTLTMAATQAGMILGTAAYMSPEQARGEPVDKRADVWAFGVVLWEMLTGKRLFQGKTTSDVLAAVLTKEPDLKHVSAKVRPLLKRCLEKAPQRRLRDIGDAMGIIENAPESRPASSRLVWTLAGLAAVLLAALAALAFVHFRTTPPEARVITTTILPPEGAAFDFLTAPNPPAISPDGRRLVFGARSADGKTRLWVRPLNSRTAQPLAGTENARFPFWSPDSKSIGFFADGRLKTIDAAGGPTMTVADAPLGHGGTWSPEGVIVFSPSETSALQRVPASGGTASPATTLDAAKDLAHKFPWFLPDGRHFLFTSLTTNTGENTIRVAALGSNESKIVVRTNSNATYADGRLLFLRQNTLMSQPFDVKRLVASGDATPVAEQVGHIFTDPSGLFSAANTGLLAYQAATGVGSMRLTWFDRSGKPSGTLADAGDFTSIEFSPDQKSLAASVSDSNGNRDIWIYDIVRGLRTRFTFDPATDEYPVWSPDGRSIVFRSNRNGDFILYRKSADGTGAEELLPTPDSPTQSAGSWSPDGRFLLYSAVGPKTSNDIWVLPLMPPPTEGIPKTFGFLQTPFRELWPKISPDGRWVAYQSDESQQFEIYVAPFHGASPSPGGKRQISTTGGTFPRWRRDGKEIFYVGPESRLMVAAVSVNGSTIEVGQVRPLGMPVITTGGGYHYDVFADGQRFLVATAPDRNATQPLTLVQNWAAGLKK